MLKPKGFSMVFVLTMFCNLFSTLLLMKTLLLSVALGLWSCLVVAQETALFARKTVPTSWIEKLQKFDYQTPANDLVSEFQTHIAPNKLVPFEQKAYLNAIFVNLDEDMADEVVLLVGSEKASGLFSPHVCVLKFVNKKWELIYGEHIKQGYAALQITSISAQHKIFYLKQDVDAPLGFYSGRKSVHHFYKLIGGEVKKCLTLLDNMDLHITPWIAEQEVRADFGFFEEYMWVIYEYNYHIKVDNFNEDISFLKNKIGMQFKWDTSKKQYLPVFENGMTKEKLASLHGESGFEQGFAEDLANIKKSGKEAEKKALQKYEEEKAKGKK